jgi:DNA-binding response OmpR family regulator
MLVGWERITLIGFSILKFEGDWYNDMSIRTSVSSTVLVIDKDVSITQMLRATLETRSFKVLTAHQVQEGLDIAREWKPDVIIFDLYMEEVDGKQVCSAIREFTHVPILALSAINKPGVVAQALDDGVDDYLIKPISTGVLVAHLNNLIRRANGKYASRTAPLNPL